MKRTATNSRKETATQFVALCCFCGHRKSEPFDACCKCGLAPKEPDDLILSALSNSVFTHVDQLQRIGKAISGGKRPGVSSEVRALFQEMLEKEGILIADETK